MESAERVGSAKTMRSQRGFDVTIVSGETECLNLSVVFGMHFIIEYIPTRRSVVAALSWGGAQLGRRSVGAASRRSVGAY